LTRFTYEGLKFDAAVLTNISHDHVTKDLSFHQYSNYKKEVFKNVLRYNKTNKFAVLPKDDKLGRERFDEMPFDKKISYSSNSSAVLKAENIQRFLNGTVFDFNYL
jgi:UDP-N-acetylmuramoyl-L-alanyl-D-glutamate--2,6-diaminopimelate ligase